MNRREIVYDALNHKDTKTVPYFVTYTRQSLQRLIEATGDPQIGEKTGSFIHFGEYLAWPTEMPDKPNFHKCDFGVVWNRSVDKDIGCLVDPQIQDLEKSTYQFPVLNEKRLRQDIENFFATKEDKFAVFGIGFSMFERLWSLMGMENALMSMITCAEALEAFMDRICEYNLKILDIILEYDVDGVIFGDDWGQQRGLIMGLTHWRRFIKPRMARMYGKVKSKGKFVIQHSCGDNLGLFNDLIEIGLDCYQTFQPEIYDIAEVKRVYGSKLSFWGAVSTQQILPWLSPQGVKDEIVRIIKILRTNGGLIIAPTHAVPYDVPPENILAMLEVFQNQEKYL